MDLLAPEVRRLVTSIVHKLASAVLRPLRLFPSYSQLCDFSIMYPGSQYRAGVIAFEIVVHP